MKRIAALILMGLALVGSALGQTPACKFAMKTVDINAPVLSHITKMDAGADKSLLRFLLKSVSTFAGDDAALLGICQIKGDKAAMAALIPIFTKSKTDMEEFANGSKQWAELRENTK